MAVLAIGGLLYAMLASRNLSKTIIESLNNRFANLDLIEQLKAQTVSLENARDVAQHFCNQAEFARAEAVEANRAKSRFRAAASHDLRQPMHALGLFAAAARPLVSTDHGQHIVDKIESSIGSMEVMFNALLDVSRLDAGILIPDVQPIDLGARLRRLVGEYAPRAEAKNLALRFRPCDCSVSSDPALLERIVRNYLSNAIRYTQRGGILLGCRIRGELLGIEVWDTGEGMPNDKLNDIFQEFYQLGNPERDKTKGLGLGLSIVKRISELLSHPIDVTSRPGRGSKFSITVPLARASSYQALESGNSPLDEAVLVSATVLIIDDEINVLEALEIVLKQWGCYVLTAESKAQALNKLKQEDRAPDAILSDYRLRDGETGIAAIKAIHREWGTTAAALITGDTATDRLKEASDSGYELLHKPLNPIRLKVALCQMLTVATPEGAPSLPHST